MNLQSALTEFSDLLEVSADALGKIVATHASSEEIQGHLTELNEVASRLREIGKRIGDISA